jgi:hypothetical protein
MQRETGDNQIEALSFERQEFLIAHGAGPFASRNELFTKIRADDVRAACVVSQYLRQHPVMGAQIKGNIKLAHYRPKAQLDIFTSALQQEVMGGKFVRKARPALCQKGSVEYLFRHGRHYLFIGPLP